MANEADSSRFGRGRVTAVRGSVVDAIFQEGRLPPVQTELRVTIDGGDGNARTIVVEVAVHVDERRVRGVALTATGGLARGASVEATGRPVAVPVGDAVLGRMFNVFGDVIDGAGAATTSMRRSIHSVPPSLVAQGRALEHRGDRSDTQARPTSGSTNR
ncbi:MAG TPA: hypothetical protein VHC70_04820, partial [Phycisphaerales bacterium]|nr:hypothetical protein [Phycisphaerales bacterium]